MVPNRGRENSLELGSLSATALNAQINAQIAPNSNVSSTSFFASLQAASASWIPKRSKPLFCRTDVRVSQLLEYKQDSI
jgi:hypothetical protein